MMTLPEINYDAIRFWIDAAILAWAFGVSGFVIWDRRNKVTQEAINKLHQDTTAAVQTLRHEVAKELADMRLNFEDRRKHVDLAVAEMRTRQADTPTRGDLTELYQAINTVSALSTELRGTVHALQNTMQLINQHLLSK
jgi:phosphoglycerate-specific signal transduction histidine kinase